MRLGIFPILPAGVAAAVKTAQSVTPPGGAPLPGVFELEEISGTASRDYLPAVIAGLIILYAMTGKKGRS